MWPLPRAPGRPPDGGRLGNGAAPPALRCPNAHPTAACPPLPRGRLLILASMCEGPPTHGGGPRAWLCLFRVRAGGCGEDAALRTRRTGPAAHSESGAALPRAAAALQPSPAQLPRLSHGRSSRGWGDEGTPPPPLRGTRMQGEHGHVGAPHLGAPPPAAAARIVAGIVG